jgi:ABC-type multidrug transport system fused ATPase/permease subunit
MFFDVPGSQYERAGGRFRRRQNHGHKLLMRYADPQQGQISIGGVDIRRLRPEQLNSLISVVFQDVWLFDDTLLANIRIARPQATQQEVEELARRSALSLFPVFRKVG